MFKSVQVKIILIIMVLAILMFLSYGIYTIQELQNSNIQNEIINKNIFVFIIITAAFVGISIIVIWFTSRVITRPIYKLIKSAEKIAEGEELKIDNSKRNTEIDGLIQAFDTMTVGLNENLNKVTRQKKQIETILQYMTDNDTGNALRRDPWRFRLRDYRYTAGTVFLQLFQREDYESLDQYREKRSAGNDR